MDARIVAGRTGSVGRTRVLLYALASGCCWVAGCLGGPGQGPVDGGQGPVDGGQGPVDGGPDDPDASPEPRFVALAKLEAPNRRSGDFFGASVALEGDVLAVGMPGEDSASRGIDGDEDDQRGQGAGAVYVFQGLQRPGRRR